jgi:hypothetical protein
MIQFVAFEFKWSIKEIESLYLDDMDFRSIEYWYEAVGAKNNSE